MGRGGGITEADYRTAIFYHSTLSIRRDLELRFIVLKRPDADYLIAFQYFDTDNNGQITFDEFKEAFSRVIGSGSESIRESSFEGSGMKKRVRKS